MVKRLADNRRISKILKYCSTIRLRRSVNFSSNKDSSETSSIYPSSFKIGTISLRTGPRRITAMSPNNENQTHLSRSRSSRLMTELVINDNIDANRKYLLSCNVGNKAGSSRLRQIPFLRAKALNTKGRTSLLICL